MKKIVTSEWKPYNSHSEYVEDAVYKLQSEGYNVTDIKRKSRGNIFFGTNVTEVTYEKVPE